MIKAVYEYTLFGETEDTYRSLILEAFPSVGGATIRVSLPAVIGYALQEYMLEERLQSHNTLLNEVVGARWGKPGQANRRMREIVCLGEREFFSTLEKVQAEVHRYIFNIQAHRGKEIREKIEKLVAVNGWTKEEVIEAMKKVEF